MKTFTIRDKIFSFLFFIFIWTLLSSLVGEGLIFPSPLEVLLSLGKLLKTPLSYKILLISLGKIMLAFFLAVLGGVFMSILSLYSRTIEAIFQPFVIIFKSVPVAAFVILALLWIGPDYLSTFIVFIVVLPVIYTNSLEGMRSADYKLLEVAEVHKFNFFKSLKYIYFPAMEDQMGAGLALAAGLGIKSGIAGEVIGRPNNSLGKAMMEAKIYLETGELFAWVLIILITSFSFERLVAWTYGRIIK